MIELTPEQQQALDQGQSVRVVDPATRNTYVVVRAEVQDRADAGLPGPEPDIPPALLKAQQAFWRDLPELLKDRRLRGQWVAYSAEGRIGIARDDTELVHACQRRGLPTGTYYLDLIEPMPQPPWLDVAEVDFGLVEISEDGDSAAS